MLQKTLLSAVCSLCVTGTVKQLVTLDPLWLPLVNLVQPTQSCCKLCTKRVCVMFTSNWLGLFLYSTQTINSVRDG